MCFIKSYCSGNRILCQDSNSIPVFPVKSVEEKPFANSMTSLDSFCNIDSSSRFSSFDYSVISSLMTSLTNNSKLLLKLHKNIEQSDNMLDQAFQMAIQKEEEDNKADSISTENWRSSDLVLQKLFGIKQYRYKLKLKHRFPAVIFKQRNMALALELVDIKDGIVLNSNLINLCVSACETTGQWISQNEEGDYFIKGKTEVELYHGKAAFQKIYPRDVSRQYPNGKLSIVIYPKTSLVQFCTYASTLQKMVKAQEIEPLIIHDLTIRAKKKSTH